METGRKHANGRGLLSSTAPAPFSQDIWTRSLCSTELICLCVHTFVKGEVQIKSQIHLGCKQTLLDTSERKARAGLPARLRVRNVGLTERSSGLSPLIWSGRMNSDIKDLLVGASLPVKQTEPFIRSSHHHSWASGLQLCLFRFAALCFRFLSV